MAFCQDFHKFWQLATSQHVSYQLNLKMDVCAGIAESNSALCLIQSGYSPLLLVPIMCQDYHS